MPAQTVIQMRRSVSSAWVSANPTLAAGEIGFESDTNKFKIGNGTDNWVALRYAGGAGGAVVSTTPPEDPDAGAIWFNSEEGRSYVYYDGFFIDLTPSIKGADGADGADGENAFHPFLIG